MLRTPTWRLRCASGWAALLVVIIASYASASEPDDPQDALDTGRLVQLALTNNPELFALHAQWTAAMERSHAAATRWPQPRVSYTSYLLAVETRQGPQRHMVSLSQAFPWLRALRDASEPDIAEAEAIAAEFDAVALRTAFDVRRQTLEIARIDALADLLGRRRAVYRDVASHQSAVMPFGGAEHGDLLRTTLMVDVLGDRIAGLEADRSVVLAGLRDLVGWSSQSDPIVVPPMLSSDEPLTLSSGELYDAVLERDPRLVALEARSRAAVARAEVASNGVLPMPTASIGWGVVGTYETPLPGTGDGGRDVFMVGLSVPLPVARAQFSHREAADEAIADGLLAQSDDLRSALRSQVDAAVVRFEEERARIERYERDLLPGARDATEHYAINISQGRGNHTEYLLAFEQELELEVALVDARFAARLEEARLDWLTGGLLSEAYGPDDLDVQVETYAEAP